MVLPYLTYFHLLWHFCKASDTRKLERLQERGLRAVFKNCNSSCEQRSRKGVSWEPAIASQITLSFWNSLNWARKECRERIKKRCWVNYDLNAPTQEDLKALKHTSAPKISCNWLTVLKGNKTQAWFIWYQVPKTILPSRQLYERLYEIWHLLTLLRPGQVRSGVRQEKNNCYTHELWLRRAYAFSVGVVSSRVGEIRCLLEKKLSSLTGLPYLPRWDNSPPSPPRVISPTRDELTTSCKRAAAFF